MLPRMIEKGELAGSKMRRDTDESNKMSLFAQNGKTPCVWVWHLHYIGPNYPKTTTYGGAEDGRAIERLYNL